MKRRSIYLIIGLVILAIIATALYYEIVGISKKSQKTSTISTIYHGDVLVVLYPYFRWEEYYEVFKILSENGYHIDVLCMKNGSRIVGIDTRGGLHYVNCKFNVGNVDLFKIVRNHNATVFIGGPGLYCILDIYASKIGLVKLDYGCLKMLGKYANFALKYLNYGVKVAKIAYSSGKIVAAICVAPTILAIAGLLHNRQFTLYRCDVTLRLVKYYNSTNVLDRPVVISGRVITGRGPSAAKDFAESILKVLTSR